MQAARPLAPPIASLSGVPTAPLGLSWPLLIALGAFAMSLASGAAMLGDADVLWHIAVGRWFILQGHVPQTDILSHSLPGAPWVAYEWLSEVLMAASYDLLGWPGIVMLAGAAGAAALALLARALLTVLEPAHALLATALAWSLLLPHWLARPHLLALPVLVLWTIVLVRARSDDAAPPLAAAALMALWANLHGSFVIGLGLGGMLAAEAVLTAPDWPARLRAAKAWALFLGLATLATLATPNFLATWWLPFHLLGQNLSLSLLVEWRSPDFQQLQPLELWLLALLFLGFARGIRLPLPRLAMLLLFVHLALKHQRHGDLLAIVGPLLIAPALGPQLRAAAGSAARLDRLMASLAAPARRGAVALAAVVALGAAALAARTQVQPPERVLPEAAVLEAQRAGAARTPVFNDYGFGGYLAFVGIPVFIDGRVDMYGDAFVARAVAAMQGGAALPAVLDDAHIGWTLLPPDSPAVALLDRMPGWRRLYADAIAVVHVRVPPAE
jgi:hypothetical protein